MWQEEVQAGTLHIFLEGAEKLPKPPENSPCSLGKGTETTAGPVHPVLEDVGATGRVPAASGVGRDLFTRTKNYPGAPSPGKAEGEEGPAVPEGPEQQVPSVSVSGDGTCPPCSSAFPEAFQVLPMFLELLAPGLACAIQGRGSMCHAGDCSLVPGMAVTSSMEPKTGVEQIQCPVPLPGRRWVRISWGAARDPGESGPRGISCPGNTEQTKSTLQSLESVHCQCRDEGRRHSRGLGG